MNQEIFNKLVRELAAREDAEIEKALNLRLGEGQWNLQDIRRRVQIHVFLGKPGKTIVLDGKPILRIYPAETETGRDGDSLKFTCSFTFEHIEA